MSVAGASLLLPTEDGRLVPYRPSEPRSFPSRGREPSSRRVFAAAHVVCDPLDPSDPVLEGGIDWDLTLAYRRHLWSHGLGVADAMDTAQRGGALRWPLALELVRRSAAEARAVKGKIVAGVVTDQLAENETSLAAIERAYLEQCELVQAAGARIAIMPSPQLALGASGPDDYARIYGTVLRSVDEPAILHWLGAAFAPALAGYWGSPSLPEAGELVLELIAHHPGKVEGVKLSVLDAEFEVAFRRRLPAGVRLYTGDDLGYPALIRGDDHGYSDALLGIFDAIAPTAAAAVCALDDGDVDAYDTVMGSTLELARQVFAAPTPHYKTGVVFLAYLNGHQPHFRMLGGLEGARSVVHLAGLFRLAGDAGLLDDPEAASERMARLLAVAGIT